MTDSERPKRRFPWALFAMSLVLVLYVLSFGPVCWSIAGTSYQSSQIVHRVYAPVLWMGSYGPYRVRDYITSYANRRCYPYAVQIHKGRLYYRMWFLCPSHFD